MAMVPLNDLPVMVPLNDLPVIGLQSHPAGGKMCFSEKTELDLTFRHNEFARHLGCQAELRHG
jgi:hypothetical protein